MCVRQWMNVEAEDPRDYLHEIDIAYPATRNALTTTCQLSSGMQPQRQQQLRYNNYLWSR